jgi:prephenate dehydrogenase
MYNPEVLKVHDKFMEVIKDFNETVQNKDEEKFIEIIQ